MSKAAFLQQLAKKLAETLPSHLSSIKNDFEKNCQTVLQQGFNKFDLVTREEFDVQCKVLKRSRQKLEVLQQQLDELEKTQSNK